jgi:mRNA interferase MazF
MTYSKYREAAKWFGLQLSINESISSLQSNFILRGSIAFAELGENIGNEMCNAKPVIVISNDQMNTSSNNVLVAVLTKSENKMDANGKIKLLPSQYLLKKSVFPFLAYDSIILFENTMCISKARLSKRIGYIDKTNMKYMERQIKRVFNLD